MRVDGAVTGGVARWLLLTCTVIGLAAMHTLGHAGSHTGGHHVAGHSAQPETMPAEQPATASAEVAAGHDAASLALLTATVVAFIDRVVDGCSGDGCAHAQPTPEPGRHDLPAWSVCLAVLAGLGVAVLLAWLLLGRTTRAGEVARRMGARLGESRAPPWPGFGLQQVSVSVIRI